MGILKGILSESIVSANQKLDIKKCVEITLENLGSSNVTVGKYPLGAGKRIVYKSSSIVLDNSEDLDIIFEGDNIANNSLYVQTIIATEVCNCINSAE